MGAGRRNATVQKINAQVDSAQRRAHCACARAVLKLLSAKATEAERRIVKGQPIESHFVVREAGNDPQARGSTVTLF
jgi:tRNA threonylcarbamoyladenosine modification (KEOPS) complex Cgi121 subunit